MNDIVDSESSRILGGARDHYQVRLMSIRYAAQYTNLYEFASSDGAPLPSTNPGAHIDVFLPNGIMRQYSLVDSGETPKSYIIGVKRDQNSRGGSRYIFDSLRVGDLLDIAGPRNNFPLVYNARAVVFFAGGIGITPIRCMIKHLEGGGSSPWKLYYACRARNEAAFIEELSENCNVHMHFDDENSGRVLDIAKLVPTIPAGAHLYCCGPAAMLAAFEAATSQYSPDLVHTEYFTPKIVRDEIGGFLVELRRSEKTFFIPEGKTILEVLAEAGMRLPSSCEQGFCGACETRILAGAPIHHDQVLSVAEKAENRTVMICCCGCRTDRLVLDL
jgi:tetrachlorobenzoquinone reductase